MKLVNKTLESCVLDLSLGGIIDLGPLGYLKAERRVYREYNFSDSEEGTQKIREVKKILKYYPSEEIICKLNA